MDTGSEYEVTITSDTTMVFVSPIRLEDCSAASEGFITMTFQKVAVQSEWLYSRVHGSAGVQL